MPGCARVNIPKTQVDFPQEHLPPASTMRVSYFHPLIPGSRDRIRVLSVLTETDICVKAFFYKKHMQHELIPPGQKPQKLGVHVTKTCVPPHQKQSCPRDR